MIFDVNTKQASAVAYPSGDNYVLASTIDGSITFVPRVSGDANNHAALANLSFGSSGHTGFQASLGFTAENTANKSTDTNLGTSNTLFPTQNAVKTYVDAQSTGSGDVTGPTSSVTDEIVLFSDLSGRKLKRATTTGILKGTSGVISAASAGSDYENPLTFSTPLSRSVDTVSIPSGSASANGFLFSGDWTRFNNKQSTFRQSRSFILSNPTVSDDSPVWRSPYAITLNDVHVLCIGGTYIVGQLERQDINGLNGVSIGIDLTANASINMNGSIANPNIASGDYLGWHTTEVSGDVTCVIVTYDYTINN